MALEVRDASHDELFSFASAGVDAWGAVAVEDGSIVGHIALSRALGEVFGHDTKYWGSDKTGAAALWFKARAKAREWGAVAVNVHMTKDTDMEIVNFWTRLGFEPTMTIYRGEI